MELFPADPIRYGYLYLEIPQYWIFLCDFVMTLFLEQTLSPGSWNKLHKGFNQSQDISYCSFYQSLREKHQEVQVTYQTFCIFDIPSYSVNNSPVQQYSLLLREIKNLFIWSFSVHCFLPWLLPEIAQLEEAGIPQIQHPFTVTGSSERWGRLGLKNTRFPPCSALAQRLLRWY